MARPLIQMALDSLDFDATEKQPVQQAYTFVLSDSSSTNDLQYDFKREKQTWQTKNHKFKLKTIKK